MSSSRKLKKILTLILRNKSSVTENNNPIQINLNLSSKLNSNSTIQQSQQVYKPLENVKDINLTTLPILRKVTMLSVGMLCKFFLNFFCRFEIKNLDTLLKLVDDQNVAKNRSLITYMNHSSTLEDPLVWGSLPPRILANTFRMRWSLAAKEILFKNWLYNRFFAAGQIIPTVRGDGIYQPAVDAAIELLNKNRWLNIYPEGKVNQTEDLINFKWGVGRMIMETKSEPIILPIYQIGMVNILPEGRIKIPKLFKDLLMVVGEPIDIKQVLLTNKQYLTLKDDNSKRTFITNLLREQMVKLRKDSLTWAKQLNVNPGFINVK